MAHALCIVKVFGSNHKKDREQEREKLVEEGNKAKIKDNHLPFTCLIVLKLSKKIRLKKNSTLRLQYRKNIG